MSSPNWHKLLRFLRASNTHLLLRTINVHLQITISDYVEPEVDEPLGLLVYSADSGQPELPTIVKLEQEGCREHKERAVDAEKPADTTGLMSHMSLRSLEECIESVSSSLFIFTELTWLVKTLQNGPTHCRSKANRRGSTAPAATT